MYQYLRFILDSDNDDHYTDSLITLPSIPYIWYRLRRDRCARSILFLQVREDDQLVIHVYDSDSRQHLMQFAKVRTSFWGAKEQSIQPDSRNDYSLQSLQMDESNLLDKLLDTNKGQAALVFTHEAFRRVCRNADKKSEKKLNNLLEDRISNFPIYVRLPFRADELEKCVSPDDRECQLLRTAYRTLIDIPGDRPEPLLQAMTDVLGSRLLRLYENADEMFYLLMSMDEPDAPDSLEDLADQAEYLELCRTLRIQLLAPDSEADRYSPLSRREVADKLRKQAFRDNLRQTVRELRNAHPGGTIQAALSQEMLLPEPLPCPAYPNDQALGLNVPDKCVSKVALTPKLDTIKRNLITLYTKPRNPLVIEITTELCRRVRSAIAFHNWVSLEEIIDLLVFFSSQICASAARNAELQTVRDQGKYLIDLCEDLQRRYNFSGLTGLDAITASSIDKADQVKVTRLREGIQRTIRFFERPSSASETIRDMEEAWTTTLQEVNQEIESLNTLQTQQQTQWQPAAAFQDDGDLSDVDISSHSHTDHDIAQVKFSEDLPDRPPEPVILSEPDPADAPVSPWDFAPGQWNAFEPAPAQELFAVEPLDPDQYLADRMRNNSTPYQERTPEYDFG